MYISFSDQKNFKPTDSTAWKIQSDIELKKGTCCAVIDCYDSWSKQP